MFRASRNPSWYQEGESWWQTPVLNELLLFAEGYVNIRIFEQNKVRSTRMRSAMRSAITIRSFSSVYHFLRLCTQLPCGSGRVIIMGWNSGSNGSSQTH